GKLMHDFFCTDPDDMHYRELAEKARYFKQDEKGVAAMCKAMEDMRKEAAEKAVWDEKVESAIRWLELGATEEMIAKGNGMTVEQVREISKSHNADSVVSP
ncbi:MAG: hypothetical protein IKX29_08415, partial [Bacteroidales bacterium]|nr:hypothetical protein [Bacteroidales bacterium]